MKKTGRVTVGVLGIAACTFATFFCAGCGDKPAEQQEIVRPVKMLKLAGGGAGLLREYPGKVEALQDAEMAFEVAGKVIEFPVSEGQLVQEGDVLAKLDPRDFQATLDAKLAEMASGLLSDREKLARSVLDWAAGQAA